MGHVGAFLKDRGLADAVGASLGRGLGGSVSVLKPRTASGSAVVVGSSDDRINRGEDGSFCVLDGEIHGETGGETNPLTRLLDGFVSRGADVLSRMDATAGITLFAAGSEHLVAARDPMGNGSMFVCRRPEGVYWSSRLRDLRAAVGATRHDPRAMDFFLANGFIPAPWTMYRSIERLGPGELVEIDASGARRVRFHDFTTSGEPTNDGSRYEILKQELPAAVRARVGDVSKTGVLLSGGVDSMLILSLVERAFGRSPKAFTFEYQQYEGPINEGRRARRAADFVGAEHQLLPVDPEALIGNLPTLVATTAEPVARTIHTVTVAGARGEGIEALLTGGGADSLYLKGGDRKSLAFASLPSVVRTPVRHAARVARGLDRGFGHRPEPSGLGKALQFADGVARAADRAADGLNIALEPEFLPDRVRRRMYLDPDQARSAHSALLTLIDRERTLLDGLEPADQMRIFELRFDSADDLLRRDLDVAQFSGVALRSPIFSANLIRRWLLQPVPTGASIRASSQELSKLDVRRLASEFLPEELAFSPKRGHSVPIHAWLRGPLRGWLNDMIAPGRLVRHGIFDPAAVGQLAESHDAGEIQVGWALWNIACIGLWLDQVDGSPPAWVDVAHLQS